MDNFLDKVAQKFNAQDVIKANSQAEAAELKRLQMQVAEYERILQEMRKLNFKNVEMADKMNSVLELNAEKLQKMQDAEQINLNKIQDLYEEQKRNYEEAAKQNAEDAKRKEEDLEREEETAKLDEELLDGLFRRSDEFNHKENVKVYRNVQAVVIEELKQQTEALCQENTRIVGKIKGISIIQVIMMILLLGSIGLNIIQLIF